MANMLDPKIVELANGYLPIFFFDPLERLFRCAAEEWLTHQVLERWDAMTTHQRGTAVLTAQKRHRHLLPLTCEQATILRMVGR